MDRVRIICRAATRVRQIRRERIWSHAAKRNAPEGTKPGMVSDNPSLSANIYHIPLKKLIFHIVGFFDTLNKSGVSSEGLDAIEFEVALPE
jgi:hypothetical protein